MQLIMFLKEAVRVEVNGRVSATFALPETHRSSLVFDLTEETYEVVGRREGTRITGSLLNCMFPGDNVCRN